MLRGLVGEVNVGAIAAQSKTRMPWRSVRGRAGDSCQEISMEGRYGRECTPVLEDA